MKTILLFILISFTLSHSGISQTELTGWGKVFPKDESDSLRSFSEFYGRLKTAVANYDAEFIYSIVDSNIELKFDDPQHNNIESFRQKFNLADTADAFWMNAKRLLGMGAFLLRIEVDIFFFPSGWFADYYHKILGENYYLGLDSNQNYAHAISDNVIVYKEANENSDIIGKLNYEIVLINNFEYEKYTPWYEIELKDGKAGYVRSEDLYLSLFDYFMTFSNKDGSWKMMAFERTQI